MLTVPAPAKLNLTLEVLGKRSDGYHEIRSVLQTIDLCDTLHFENGQGIIIECDMPGWSAEESLVTRTVALLQEVAAGSRGARIEIEKRLPLMSGLGGDSSDAAAVLRGLNELWELGLSQEKLLDLAARLGSDVSFFLQGGAALAEGRGEIIKPLPGLSGMWFLLVVPDVPAEPGKTAKMYDSLKPACFTDGRLTEKLVAVLREGGEFSPSLLFNTFENIAFDCFKGLKVYKEHILRLGAPHVHLAGSGPTLFTMFEDRAQAGDLYARCKQQGMVVYLAGIL